MNLIQVPSITKYIVRKEIDSFNVWKISDENQFVIKVQYFRNMFPHTP